MDRAPLAMAKCSGERPSRSRGDTRHPGEDRRRTLAAEEPLAAAKCRGVILELLVALASASERRRKETTWGLLP